MKILLVSAASNIHTVRWANALDARGHKIYLVSLPNHKESVDAYNATVEIRYLPFSGAKGYYLNAYHIKKIVKEIKPDVINVHYASGYGTLARIAHMPRIILSVWGSDVYDFPYENKVKKYILIKNLKYAKMIASTSHSMAAQVQKLIGKKDIAVTPFGVNVSLFKKNNAVKDQEFTIGIVKTLKEKYGIPTVIKAFSEFYKKYPESKAKLLIYGKGEQKDELLQLCKDLDIQKQVYFEGYIPNSEVPQALNNMDVVTLGSVLDSESFGVSAVEAMACEIPVVATDVSGFKEVIVHGESGFIVPRYDYKAMANYIELLYQDIELRKKIGQNARVRVLENYDWDNNVDLMLELYKQNSK